jgi:hypothetical protein
MLLSMSLLGTDDGCFHVLVLVWGRHVISPCFTHNSTCRNSSCDWNTFSVRLFGTQHAHNFLLTVWSSTMLCALSSEMSSLSNVSELNACPLHYRQSAWHTLPPVVDVLRLLDSCCCQGHYTIPRLFPWHNMCSAHHHQPGMNVNCCDTLHLQKSDHTAYFNIWPCSSIPAIFLNCLTQLGHTSVLSFNRSDTHGTSWNMQLARAVSQKTCY